MLEPLPGLPVTSKLLLLAMKVFPSTLPPLEETTPPSKVIRTSVLALEEVKEPPLPLTLILSPSRVTEKPSDEPDLSTTSLRLPLLSMVQTSTPWYCSTSILSTFLPIFVELASLLLFSQRLLVDIPYCSGTCILSDKVTSSPLNLSSVQVFTSSA